MTKAIVLIGLTLMEQIKSLAGLPSQGKASPLRILNRALLSAAFTGIFFVLVVPAFAQTETATVSGRATDADGRVVPDVQIELVNAETNVVVTAKTNAEGLYVIANVHPGVYGLRVAKNGFKTIVETGLVLHVQDRVEENFSLQVGSLSETVTITADLLNINTTDASVSTVVDRQFAENLPLNGRSFQSLIQLTPGVVVTAVNSGDTGQFSVNGQRADANYWMVDGVSANIGISANGFIGTGVSGTLGATNAFGGTNSLVSVDALQEFRIQTSTYAPEFGRTPGGQISIITRSGTTQFHGSAFEYFRNDVLDAGDWFANNAGLPKAKERQNDFGGTFGGPIPKVSNTFFFFSYEGLRLRLPTTGLSLVPDTSAADPFSRQFAVAAMQPFLNAYPLPNGPEVLDANGNHQGIAQFNTTFSNPASLDAYSIRVDHRFGDKLNVFGRYNYAPSSITTRGFSGTSLSSIFPQTINTQNATVGATWSISQATVTDFRFNFSKTDAFSAYHLDNLGGATPLTTLPLPPGVTAQNGGFRFSISSLGIFSDLIAGASNFNQQRQFNIVDSVSTQKGSHGLRFGVDYRRLTPILAAGPDAANLNQYFLGAHFTDIPSTNAGTPAFGIVQNTLPVTFLLRNLGVFAQDTWRISPRLTVTYGLRWDVDFVPSTVNGPELNAVTGFSLSDLSQLALLPPGMRPYATKWGDVAPRVGLAYQLSQSDRWKTVLRGGFGVFYDLSSSETGHLYNPVSFPYGGFGFVFGNFPYDPIPAAPPIVPPNLQNAGQLYAADPNLRLPYTLQWNVAFEQVLGKQQTFTASYVGAAGRRLIQSAFITSPPNANFTNVGLVTNFGTSDYHALQLQFQRRLSGGLQALASYTWSHSIDTGSAGSTGSVSNGIATVNPADNRGDSDFDIRHAASVAITYDVPAPKSNAFANAILRGWSLDNIFQARSATPVSVYYGIFDFASTLLGAVRPDIVPGQPLYLHGSQYPGGKAFNPLAFTHPPVTPAGCTPGSTGCNPVREGNLGRNALRGFGAAQWDFAVHRDFPIHEAVRLEFRAEMFNVVNHPNFGPPSADLSQAQFGLSNQMLAASLAGGQVGGGAFHPLYQLGGPRSIQFALKLLF